MLTNLGASALKEFKFLFGRLEPRELIRRAAKKQV